MSTSIAIVFLFISGKIKILIKKKLQKLIIIHNLIIIKVYWKIVKINRCKSRNSLQWLKQRYGNLVVTLVNLTNSHQKIK